MATEKFNEYVFGKGAHLERNLALHKRILATRDRLRKERAADKPPVLSQYPLSKLIDEINGLLGKAGINGTASLAPVVREKFDADFCVTVPALLKSMGSKEYITQMVPRIEQAVAASALVSGGTVTRIDKKGIYLNLKFSDAYLLQSLQCAGELGPQYGRSDALSGKAVVIDYSAPNVAKHLHAGHIRSTIIGETLRHFYLAVGAEVHGVNHINDLGGFGFLLEGWRRWQELLPPGAPGDRLAGLYGIFRRLEKIAEEKKELSTLSAEDQALIRQYFPDCGTLAAFSAAWAEYAAASTRRYGLLEDGDATEVALWTQMVEWSLADFQNFYDVLGVEFDYVIGESFYAADGAAVVAKALASGIACVFSPEDAKRECAELDRELGEGKINEQQHQALSDAARAEVNATVIELAPHDRLVAQRSDGRTIYATRDLGAVHYRVMTFSPWRMAYEVGQEQKEHFQQFFAASRKLGIDGGAEFEHLYHGFYVDSKTKKKLSSRDGASNVHRLLADTTKHFEDKYRENTEMGAEEKARTSRQLAVGSIIINDIKKDKKSNVEINSDISKAVEEFEHAGGAYLMYSACRARSILRKYGKEVPEAKTLAPAALETIEAELIKLLLDFPGRVRQAAENEDPPVLVNHLFETARLYNSYYNACPVIKGGEVHLHRLVLTRAAAIMLENGLRMCHVQCPERI